MNLLPLQRDAWSTEFFDAAARGRLMALRCQDCHEWSGPQARRCAYCSSNQVSWAEATGHGKIVSWTAPHLRDGDSSRPAYVVALVELDEGPWIYAQGAADLELDPGHPVAITFAPVEGGEPLPVIAVP